MAEILDIYDPGAEQSEKDEVIRKNMATLTKQGLKSGTYSLVDTVDTTINSITSTAFVNLTALTGSFNSSGGLVLVDLSIFVNVNGFTAYVGLFIDGMQQAWSVNTATTSNVGSCVNINRWLQLNAGNHKYEIKARVSSGTGLFGDNVTKTTLSIVEFLRG